MISFYGYENIVITAYLSNVLIVFLSFLLQLQLKRTAANSGVTKASTKKAKSTGSKKKKKKDPNEPQK